MWKMQGRGGKRAKEEETERDKDRDRDRERKRKKEKERVSKRERRWILFSPNRYVTLCLLI
jgi:hypothetical protein